MNKALKRAIEGGWQNPVHLVSEMDKNGKVVILSGYPEKVAVVWTTPDIIFDQFFWQALGKAEGWAVSDEAYLCDYCGVIGVGTWNHMNDCKIKDRKISFKAYWHRFIDHLAEGKDVEIFFKQLLS